MPRAHAHSLCGQTQQGGESVDSVPLLPKSVSPPPAPLWRSVAVPLALGVECCQPALGACVSLRPALVRPHLGSPALRVGGAKAASLGNCAEKVAAGGGQGAWLRFLLPLGTR